MTSSPLRLLALTTFVIAPTLGAQDSSIVIRAGRLLDGRGASVAGATVVVRGATITSAGPASSGSVTYDLSRYTVLPGLIDVHEHVGWHFNASGRFHANGDGETIVDETLAGAGNAYTILMAGWTTIASPGLASDGPLRDAIARGVLP